MENCIRKKIHFLLNSHALPPSTSKPSIPLHTIHTCSFHTSQIKTISSTQSYPQQNQKRPISSFTSSHPPQRSEDNISTWQDLGLIKNATSLLDNTKPEENEQEQEHSTFDYTPHYKTYTPKQKQTKSQPKHPPPLAAHSEYESEKKEPLVNVFFFVNFGIFFFSRIVTPFS